MPASSRFMDRLSGSWCEAELVHIISLTHHNASIQLFLFQATMDVSRKLCLKWGNFQSGVTSMFDNLRKDEELVDITLCCEGKKIKAHRMMLSACSPYFRELFKVSVVN